MSGFVDSITEEKDKIHRYIFGLTTVTEDDRIVKSIAELKDGSLEFLISELETVLIRLKNHL